MMRFLIPAFATTVCLGQVDFVQGGGGGGAALLDQKQTPHQVHLGAIGPPWTRGEIEVARI